MQRVLNWWVGGETNGNESQTSSKQKENYVTDSLTLEIESTAVVVGQEIKGKVSLSNSTPLPQGALLRLQVRGAEHVQFMEGKEKIDEEIRSVLNVTCEAYKVDDSLDSGVHTFPFTFRVPEDLPSSFAFETKTFAACVSYLLSASFSDIPDRDFQTSKRFLVAENPSTGISYSESKYKMSKSQRIFNRIFLAKSCFSDLERVIVKYIPNSTLIKPVDSLTCKLVQRIEVSCNGEIKAIEKTLESKDFPGLPSCFYGERYLQGLTIPSITSYTTRGMIIKSQHFLTLEGLIHNTEHLIPFGDLPITIAPVCKPAPQKFDPVEKQYRPDWELDSSVTCCNECQRNFSFFLRRHHCRHCGMIFCTVCCKRFTNMPNLGYHNPVRVCDGCFDVATCGGNSFDKIIDFGEDNYQSFAENSTTPTIKETQASQLQQQQEQQPE